MNFLVIGQSVVDKIHDGNILLVKPGGIFYTAVALKGFFEKGDKLFLCTTVDDMSYRLFSVIYDEVEREFIKNIERIPVVNLILKSSGERDEVYEYISENLEIDFTNLNRFSGILINMITGFDISIKQMQEIRKNYNGIIYFDVHTLSRGLIKNNKRVFRPVPDFFKWAKCIDILQANRHELQTLSVKKNEREIVKDLLNFGIKQVVVTKASDGAIVYFCKNGELKSINRKSFNTVAVDKVGCGDVFGAVYFYNYIRNKNVNEAILYANAAAGNSTRYLEVKDFLNIKNDVRKQLN
jgi:sugar/nucleoside kinase (ribokinase family)